MRLNPERFVFVMFLIVWSFTMWQLLRGSMVIGRLLPTGSPIDHVHSVMQNGELPQLYTDHNVVRRFDTHQSVILKGFTSESFRGDEPDPELAIKHIDIVRSWGANIMNIYVNPNLLLDTEDTWQKLDEVVKYALSKHIYISIQPVVSYEENKEFENGHGYDKAMTFIEKIRVVVPKMVQHYQQYPHVMYGTWTEPHPFSAYAPYFEMSKNIIHIVHSIYPHVIFMVDVSMGDLANLEKESLIFSNNVIYHRSYYYGKDIHSVGVPVVRGPELVGTGSGVMAAPYMVSEMGAYYGGDFNSEADINTTRSMLDVLQDHGIPYIGYVLDDYHVLALTDAEGNPTKKGDVFVEHLREYPPTKF